ncbi:NAD(P)-dependent oxidoreductase [Microbacterium sp. LWH3-1.2]|uniref:NAD(P)-dependent oxidoreductase n=1 Tax=Microbacterium sp. LWH3-1.2 TaxID=3135256 RepID=UPI00343377BB
MNHIGFLGLGRMGAAISLRVARSGSPIVVWNRTRLAPDSELLSAGLTQADSAAEALAAPVSFSMLADDSAADAVLSRANIGAAAYGRVHVNLASVSAQMADLLTRRFADAGVTYIAAPVLGRPEVAAEGALNILVAGPQHAVAEVDPLLAFASVKRWYLGESPRQANAVKVAMNFMLLHALESMAEGIALVEAEGVNGSDFVDLFTTTFFGGPIHRVYGRIIADRRYDPPGFTVALGLKDLSLAEQLAAERRVELPTAPVLRARFETALADPQLAGLDWSVIAELGRATAS